MRVTRSKKYLGEARVENSLTVQYVAFVYTDIIISISDRLPVECILEATTLFMLSYWKRSKNMRLKHTIVYLSMFVISSTTGIMQVRLSP